MKFAQFLLIVLLGIAADQGTKWYASERLATQNAHPQNSFSHNMYIPIDAARDGQTVQQILTGELAWSTPDEIRTLGKFYAYEKDGRRLSPQHKLLKGQTLELKRREVTIVKEYWDFQYTRNPGAAFGFLADSDSPLRRPFFITISVVALAIILYILSGLALSQQLMIWGLSLIASGAIGNFIDRVRFNYVIDFILWKYTDAHRWPTFNVADVWICIGVGLMLIEITREAYLEHRAEQAASVADAGDAPEGEGDDPIAA